MIIHFHSDYNNIFKIFCFQRVNIMVYFIVGGDMMFSMTVPPQVSAVLDRLNDGGFEAYLVGGCVRDALMGREPHDFDVTTSALPKETSKVFRKMPVIKTGIKHGTVMVLSQKMPVEVTTFRADGEYLDNRRPESVTFVPDLESDLGRRDFTVNAMAWSQERGVVDLFGGREDLKNGIIRCVGDPEKRFNED
jgi:tRNA nucleotidyltransferase (CCA-adding enzyme)